MGRGHRLAEVEGWPPEQGHGADAPERAAHAQRSAAAQPEGLMANEELFSILGKGISSWNQWREFNALRNPDLQAADLRGQGLHGVDFVGAHLNGADLSEADLSGAFLNTANLRGANLTEAKLMRANLQGADLRWTKEVISI
jgi:uncharacterized protein YjbI with pentapeptide repeats